MWVAQLRSEQRCTPPPRPDLPPCWEGMLPPAAPSLPMSPALGADVPSVTRTQRPQPCPPSPPPPIAPPVLAQPPSQMASDGHQLLLSQARNNKGTPRPKKKENITNNNNKKVNPYNKSLKGEDSAAYLWSCSGLLSAGGGPGLPGSGFMPRECPGPGMDENCIPAPGCVVSSEGGTGLGASSRVPRELGAECYGVCSVWLEKKPVCSAGKVGC